MPIGSQLNKLKEKIESSKKDKSPQLDFQEKKIKLNASNKMLTEKKKKDEINKELGFLKNLLRMIENGATGFDLAFEVEKHQLVKKLIYDGVLFYNAFIEIGNNAFIEAPDKREVNYKAFKTVEETEKHLFIIWLKDTIANMEKKVSPEDAYDKYKKVKEKKNELIINCKYCGARIKDKNQKFCEMCGSECLF